MPVFVQAYDYFGKKTKQQRKTVQAQLQAAIIEKQEAFKREQAAAIAKREAAAVENLRKKLVILMSRVNMIAQESAEFMDRARKLVSAPELDGDPTLNDFDVIASDMEQALVQIQVGTVADTGSLDSRVLAVSYAEAQGALTATNALRGRVIELLHKLETRLSEIKNAKIRAEWEAREQERQASLAVQRQAAAQAELETKAARERINAAREADAARVQRSIELDQEISKEKARLRDALSEIEAFKSGR